jgi:hypothetical protein
VRGKAKSKPFNGAINLDVRDSFMDCDAFRDPPAPAGSPNVLVVRYDDTGLAAWSPMAGGSRCRRWTGSRLRD